MLLTDRILVFAGMTTECCSIQDLGRETKILKLVQVQTVLAGTGSGVGTGV